MLTPFGHVTYSQVPGIRTQIALVAITLHTVQCISKHAELVSEVWKNISETILKHSLKIFCFSKTLNVTEYIMWGGGVNTNDYDLKVTQKSHTLSRKKFGGIAHLIYYIYPFHFIYAQE